MNDIIQNLQADCFNGEKYFCLMSENKLNALKELSKREEQENEELKKQLEENKNPLKGIFAQVNDDMLLRNCGTMHSEIDEYKNQQKEFIDWLEIEIISYEELNKELILSNYKKEIKVLKEVLSKYKDITGDDSNEWSDK